MNFIFEWQKTIFYSLAALVRKILFAASAIFSGVRFRTCLTLRWTSQLQLRFDAHLL